MNEKIAELREKVELLSSIIIKAQKYAEVDPETSLMQARKSAEAICRNIFSAEIGDPGKIMLDELIKKLAERKIIPNKILIPLGTIQAYGNYGAHAQSDGGAVDQIYITPCLSALSHVVDWYFSEYLKVAIPDEILLGSAKSHSKNNSDLSNNTKVIEPEHLPSNQSFMTNQGDAPPVNKIHHTNKRLIYTVSAIIIILIISYVIISQNTNTTISNSNQVYIDSSQHKKSDSSMMGTGTNVTDNLTKVSKEEVPVLPETTAVKKIDMKKNNTTQREMPVLSSEKIIKKTYDSLAERSSLDTPKSSPHEPRLISDPPLFQKLDEPLTILREGKLDPARVGGNPPIDGFAEVNVLVEMDGKISKVRILSVSDQKLQRFVKEVALDYVFKPPLINQLPVRAWAPIKIRLTKSN